MGTQARVAALGLALALLSALAIAGCGGGGDSSSSTQGAGSQPASNEEHKGGEASIEEFGTEAEGSDREAILAVFTGYLEALGEKDYETACSHLDAELQRSLQQLIGKGSKTDCAQILPRLLSPSAPAIARQQADGHIAKVRFEEDRGFVVFKAPGAKLYQQNMVAEGGEWKVGTVASSVLVPEL